MSKSHCPSCGQYVGPYEACPYCGARLTGRTPIRTVKIAAILLASLGLVALWIAATRTQVPLIRIEQAGATMNMAYVRLQGHCSRAPSYDPETNYLSFWVEDETGEIRVSSYRAETQALIDQGRVPALGDELEMAGTLRVREDFLALTLNVPEQLVIHRPDPVDRAIGSLGVDDRYDRVRVQGEVRSVYEPYDGLTLVTVRDETGSIPVALSEELIALSGITPTVESGQYVAVTGSVSLYDDTPQLIPASVADIVPIDEPASVVPERFIGELTADDVGQWVRIEGSVAAANDFSAGRKLTLDDGTGTIIVLLWDSVIEALDDPQALGPGAALAVRGEISEYEGELELIPELADDVTVVEPAPARPPAPAAPESEMRPIGDLTPVDVGQTLTLSGTLGEPEPFSAGVKFMLTDETGQITLLLWENVYQALSNADQLTAGTPVEVEGEIEEYQGELEIIPQAAGVRIVD